MHNEGVTTDSEWIRDGGRICLDFVNTLRSRWRSTPEETLRAPEDLRRWLGDARLLAPAAPASGGAAGLRSGLLLREAVDRAVMAVAAGTLPDADDVSLLNRTSSAGRRPALRLVVRDGRLAGAPTADLAGDLDTALALVAQDAVDLLLSADVRHVRVCASDNCAVRFLDRSPARNRRWCSMSRCGNRAKVRLHQARSRARAAQESDPSQSL